MRIAHFAIFAPHSSGQYGTVRDLILAERLAGVDAGFIDCGAEDNYAVREGLVDGEIEAMPESWADDADVIIRHTSVPERFYGKKPVVLAIHGRPESSFKIEHNEKSKIISIIKNDISMGRYASIFTFWKEHVYLWKNIYGADINYVPAPVDTNEYCPEGEKHDFGQWKAGKNLVIADMWRDDHTPFNLLFAAQYFKDTFHSDTKLHLYGVPTKKSCFSFLGRMQKNGVVGEVAGQIAWINKVYRGADAVLTPNIIATRVIREAMSTGVPVIAPFGCPYTKHVAEPRDYAGFAKAINSALLEATPAEKHRLRELAKTEFDPSKTANAIIDICAKVM